MELKTEYGGSIIQRSHRLRYTSGNSWSSWNVFKYNVQQSVERRSGQEPSAVSREYGGNDSSCATEDGQLLDQLDVLLLASQGLSSVELSQQQSSLLPILRSTGEVDYLNAVYRTRSCRRVVGEKHPSRHPSGGKLQSIPSSRSPERLASQFLPCLCRPRALTLQARTLVCLPFIP